MGPKSAKISSAIFWVPVVFGSLLAGLLPMLTKHPRIRHQVEQARDSIPETTLKMISTAQNVYRKEFGHYARTFAEFKATCEGFGVTCYLLKEEVPEEILKLVPEADYPRAFDQSYRVLFVWQRSPDEEARIWVMSENGIPRKIR